MTVLCVSHALGKILRMSTSRTRALTPRLPGQPVIPCRGNPASVRTRICRQRSGIHRTTTKRKMRIRMSDLSWTAFFFLDGSGRGFHFGVRRSHSFGWRWLILRWRRFPGLCGSYSIGSDFRFHDLKCKYGGIDNWLCLTLRLVTAPVEFPL